MTDDELNDGRVSYYYSREERLKNASPSLRDFNDPSNNRKAGIFRTLTASGPLTFLFISIIVICLLLFLTHFLTGRGELVLGNNTIVLSTVGAGDNSYITVKKTRTAKQRPNSGGVYTGDVDIAVSIPGEGNLIHAERIYFSPEQEELFRFVVPFRGKTLIVLMEAGAQRITHTITPE